MAADPASRAPAAPADEQDLCRKCGLCCDGSLFHYTPVADGEDLPEVLAAAIDPADSGFPQPCPCFCGECTVYARRPRRCVVYRCLLLDDFESRRISRETAETTIAEVRALQGRIYENADANHLAFRQDVNRIVEACRNDPALARDHADTLLDIAAYNVMCRRFATMIELQEGVARVVNDPAASS